LAQLDAPRITADLRQALDDTGFASERFEPYMGFLQTILGRRDVPGLQELLRYPDLADLLLPRTASVQHLPNEAIQLVFTAPGDDSLAHRQATLQAIRQSLSGLDGVVVTGLTVLGQDMQFTVYHDFPVLLLASVLAVTLYILLQFRDWRRTAIAMLPIFGALLLLLVIANLAGQRLNTINLIAAPLLVGLGGDYGIFVVALLASRSGPTQWTPQQLEPTIATILTCALTTLLGFGSLYYTSVPAVQSLGFAVGVGVSACLLLTLAMALPLSCRSIGPQEK
jgi:predicted RND superfamily exporter protein